MVRVNVECFGELRRFFNKGENQRELEMEEGAAVTDIYRRLGIPLGDIYGASVNGEWVEPQRPLADGDRVLLFPPMTGG